MTLNDPNENFPDPVAGAEPAVSIVPVSPGATQAFVAGVPVTVVPVSPAPAPIPVVEPSAPAVIEHRRAPVIETVRPAVIEHRRPPVVVTETERPAVVEHRHAPVVVTEPAPPSAAEEAAVYTPTPRVLSLDALRGFDMFWIVGGEGLIQAAAHLWPNVHGLQVMAGQLQHKTWEGIAAYDLIFPTFVFLVGVSLVFSLTKQVALGGRGRAIRRVVVRTIVLYILGLLYYGGLSGRFVDVRLLGVLQRIALAYGFAGIMFCLWRARTLVAVCFGLLVVYWALLSFVPVPGVGHASFEEGRNLTNWFDSKYLPGFKWDKTHDPEGILSTLPAVATCLLGVFAGLILRAPRVAGWQKVIVLLFGGALLGAAGYLWAGQIPQVHVPEHVRFPLIKKLWTSSYVLAAAGYGAVLLGLFYLVIDVIKLRGWAKPFVWIGANAITLYLLEHFLDFNKLASLFVGGEFSKRFLSGWAELVASLVAVLIMFAFARFLYKRQVFIRV